MVELSLFHWYSKWSSFLPGLIMASGFPNASIEVVISHGKASRPICTPLLCSNSVCISTLLKKDLYFLSLASRGNSIGREIS